MTDEVEWNMYSSVWVRATVLKRSGLRLTIRLHDSGEIVVVDRMATRRITSADAERTS